MAAQKRALVRVKTGGAWACGVEPHIRPIAVPVGSALAWYVPEDLGGKDGTCILIIGSFDKQLVELAVPVGRCAQEPFKIREELQVAGPVTRVSKCHQPQLARIALRHCIRDLRSYVAMLARDDGVAQAVANRIILQALANGLAT